MTPSGKLNGSLAKRAHKLWNEFAVPLSETLQSEMLHLPAGNEKKALIQISNDLSTVTRAIVTLCKEDEPSSLVPAVLMRTLLDGCISAFAFAQDPPKRAELYLNFTVVFDWQSACDAERHMGCPLLPDTSEIRAKVSGRKKESSMALKKLGAPYAKPKTGQEPHDRLNEALLPKNELKSGFLRETWFPETRRALLKAEHMEWAYDKFYERYSSAVHLDVAASKVMSDMPTNSIFSLAVQFWSAAVYRLVNAFGIAVCDEHMRTLKMYYEELQHIVPKGSRPQHETGTPPLW